MNARLFLVAILFVTLSFGGVHQHLVINPLNVSLKFDQNISLSLSTKKLERSGDWLELGWAGVENPSVNDWIAVYSPPSAYPKQSYVKYQFASVSPTHLSRGEGSMKFSLINLYSDYMFVFYRNGTDYPIAAAFSDYVTFSKVDTPLRGHLTLTSNPSEMRISWASMRTNNQYVKWGTQPGQYTSSVLSEYITYTPKDLCGSPATDYGWKDPFYFRTAIMNKLQPRQRYYYIYGSDDTEWSKESSFVASPVTDANSNVDLIAFGDYGKMEVDDTIEHWEEKAAMNTTRRILSHLDEIDLITHIGDISYAVGYAAQWEIFMHQIEPIASKVPYLTIPGNHEYDYPNAGTVFTVEDSAGECGVPYEARFIMPGTVPKKPWNQFNYGNIHFVMMSTEHNFSRGSEQYNFLKNALSQVDRSKTPWVIFGGHRPMYVSSTNFKPPAGDQVSAKMLKDEIEDLLYHYKVDLAIWGHHHSYQRTCPVYKEECQPGRTAPIHAVIGMAGFTLSTNIENPSPPWIEKVTCETFGYTRIQTNSTHFMFRFFTDQDDTLYDELILKK